MAEIEAARSKLSEGSAKENIENDGNYGYDKAGSEDAEGSTGLSSRDDEAIDYYWEHEDGSTDTFAGAGKRSNAAMPYIKSRPSYGKTQVEDVWNGNIELETGNVLDPTGKIISWDKTKPRLGQWDMGHIPGQKYSDFHQKYISGEMIYIDFLEWYRNPANYRTELPGTNRSRKYE